MKRQLFIILQSVVLGFPLFSQQNVSCGEFFAMIDTCESAVVLDVRIEEEFEQDRIPGAIYAGEKAVLLELVQDFEKNVAILLYCEYGDRSKTVMKILKKRGFSNLYHLKKGYKEWREEGFPIDQNPIEK